MYYANIHQYFDILLPVLYPLSILVTTSKAIIELTFEILRNTLLISIIYITHILCLNILCFIKTFDPIIQWRRKQKKVGGAQV